MFIISEAIYFIYPLSLIKFPIINQFILISLLITTTHAQQHPWGALDLHSSKVPSVIFTAPSPQTWTWENPTWKTTLKPTRASISWRLNQERTTKKPQPWREILRGFNQRRKRVQMVQERQLVESLGHSDDCRYLRLSRSRRLSLILESVHW